MSNESKERSRSKTRKTARELERPFKAAVLSRAKALASEYTMTLQPHPQLGFMGSSVELPMVFTHGKTERQCITTTREALAVAVGVMIEHGEVPPAAASEHRRNLQLNIRLTSEEKLLLESAAKRRGFRGVSDLMRIASLEYTRRSA